MWQLAFALVLTAGVATALLAPNRLDYIKVDANYTLGGACFFLGLATTTSRFKDLFGTPLGLGNVAFSLFIGTFVWPALGLAATVLALQYGLPLAVVVGFALLAACPVGGPSNGVNIQTAGGSLECSVLMCFLSTPAALITFPYAYHHFLLLLLDQPLSPALTPEAAAADNDFRARLLASTFVPPTVMASIRNHALLAACLPIAAGAAVSALLPPSAAARRAAPMLAATMIVLTASTKTAGGIGAVVAAGAAGVWAVVALHVAALVLGFLIPAAGGSPGRTCRTTAYQASMRNPALGLALATALFGGSSDFPLVAAPCIISIFVQNTLAAWTALLGAVRQPSLPRSESGQPLSPQAFRATSMDALLRQPTFRRTSDRQSGGTKED